MEYSKIRKSLKKFGLNFNNKIVKAIEDIHKDTDGSESSSNTSITEITDDNLDAAIKKARSIVVKPGAQITSFDDVEALVQTVTLNSLNRILYSLYIYTDSGLIPLPIKYLNDFISVGLPCMFTMDLYDVSFSISELGMTEEMEFLMTFPQHQYSATMESDYGEGVGMVTTTVNFEYKKSFSIPCYITMDGTFTDDVFNETEVTIEEFIAQHEDKYRIVLMGGHLDYSQVLAGDMPSSSIHTVRYYSPATEFYDAYCAFSITDLAAASPNLTEQLLNIVNPSNLLIVNQ